MSASNQSLCFIFSLRLYSSFITSRQVCPDLGPNCLQRLSPDNKSHHYRVHFLETYLYVQCCHFKLGSYRQVLVKFKDLSRTSERLSYCFQGLRTYENADLHIKILFQKCNTALLKILVLENKYKIVVPIYIWCSICCTK